MTTNIQDLLAPPGLQATSFPSTSRYHGLGTAVLEDAEGQTRVFLKRRFLSPPENFSLLEIHKVVQGDRIDNLAHQYLGDAGQYWRICDANNVLKPTDLTDAVGTEVRITLPAGIPGVSDA